MSLFVTICVWTVLLQEETIARNDSAFVIPGKLIIKLKPAATSAFGHLLRRSPNPPSEAVTMQNHLYSRGVRKFQYLDRTPNTIFSKFVILELDSSEDITEKYEAIRELPFVDRVYYDYSWHGNPALGCYTMHDSSYAMEDTMAQREYVDTQDLYPDGDMSWKEAWEFTKGDSSVIVAVDGGGPIWAAPMGSNGPQFQELSDHVLTGKNYVNRDECLRCIQDSIRKDSTIRIDSLRYQRVMDTCSYHYDLYKTWGYTSPLAPLLEVISADHGTAVAKVLTANHDTTTQRFWPKATRGEIGFAPGIRFIPYVTNAKGSYVAEAIFDAATRNCVVYNLSAVITNDSMFIYVNPKDSSVVMHKYGNVLFSRTVVDIISGESTSCEKPLPSLSLNKNARHLPNGLVVVAHPHDSSSVRK